VSMRPRQWVKNVFVFAGLIFAQRLFTSSAWIALAAFAIFCGLSGAIYLINDVADRERDRLDPRKRTRPVAAGQLSVGAALATAGALLQGTFRNPLADPGVIGISSGAALGAVTVIVLALAPFGTWSVTVGAFIAGLLTAVLVYGASRSGGRTEVVTLVLTGIAFAFLFAACAALFRSPMHP